MTEPTLGPFLLRRRIGVDDLGFAFAATSSTGRGQTEYFVRTFPHSGSGDTPSWRQAIADRSKVPAASAATVAAVASGVPFLAYAGLTGLPLSALSATAAYRDEPLPFDHGVTLMQQLTTGWAAAGVVHGCITPGLVIVDGGYAHLIGWEFAHCLPLGIEPRQRRAVIPYLSARVLAGSEPRAGDDVYSLTVMLLELATGVPAQIRSEAHSEAELQTARLTDGTLFHPRWVSLLRCGLTPGADGFGSVSEWSRELTECLHATLRPASRESLSLLVERLSAPDPPLRGPWPKHPAPEVAAIEQTQPVPRLPASDAEGPVPSTQPAATGRGGILARRWLAAAALAALVVVGWRSLSRREQRLPQQSQQLVTTAADPTAERAHSATEASAPPVKPLQVETRATAPAPEPPPTIDQPPASTAKTPIPRTTMTAPERSPPPPPAEPRTRVAAALTEAAMITALPTVAMDPAPSPPALTRLDRSRSPSGTTRPAAPEQPSLPKLALPEAWHGQLVIDGPGVVAPQAVRLPRPRLPRGVKGQQRDLVVPVRVLVDENGTPLEVEVVAAEGLAPSVTERAKKACLKGLFSPPTKGGVRVKMWTTVHVRFSN